MHNYLFILLLISLPSWGFTDSKTDFIQEGQKFISKLNAKFSIDVKLKKVNRTVCGLGSSFNNKEPSIVYCDRDISFYDSLKPSDDPLASFLTVISHEYSHILVDFDMSSEARGAARENEKLLLNYISSIIQSNPRRLAQIEIAKPLESYSVPDTINFILSNDHHENIDSLGIKLMLLTQEEPNLDVMKVVAQSDDAPSFFKYFIEPRTKVLKQSYIDGLGSWSNFRCIGNQFHFPQTNIVLKSFLFKEGYLEILDALEKQCDQHEVIQMFFDLLDQYYPLSGTGGRTIVNRHHPHTQTTIMR